MATTLLEALRQRQQDTPGTLSSQTEEAQRLLAAKSGKVGGTAGGPRISSLGEQVAEQQTQAQLGQVQAEGQIAEQQQLGQSQEIAEKERAGRTEIGQARRANQLKISIATNDTMRELEQGRRTLNYERDKAAYDQLASGLALQDKGYLNDLRTRAAKDRLDDEATFMRQYQRSQLGDMENLLRTKLRSDSILQAKKRDLEKFIATMNVDDAIAIARSQMQAASTAQKWSGIGGVASATVGAYAKSGSTGKSEDQE